MIFVVHPYSTAFRPACLAKRLHCTPLRPLGNKSQVCSRRGDLQTWRSKRQRCRKMLVADKSQGGKGFDYYIGQMQDFVRRNNVRRSKKIVTYAGHCVRRGPALEKKGSYIFTPDTDFVRRNNVRRSKKFGNYAGHCPALSGVPSGSYKKPLYITTEH